MSKKADRINKLVEIIKSKNMASVKELAAILNVSEMTIRRDLTLLEKENTITTAYGAVIYNPPEKENSLINNYELENAQMTRSDEKIKIGIYAASLIEDDDIIMIDTGSTTETLAQNVAPDLKATFICYNVNILNYLRLKRNLNIIFSGGRFHPQTQMFESPEGISLIKSMRATKAFISAAGVHESLGITCAYNYEVQTKKALLSSSVEKILLVDSSKFDTVKPAYFSNLENFDTIVTDRGIPAKWKEIIEKKGIELHIVD